MISAPNLASRSSQTSSVESPDWLDPGRGAAQSCGPEQRVALLQHPVVVGAGAGVPRPPVEHEQVVSEPAALGRVALDQREVVGCEQDGAHQAEQVAGPRELAAVDAGAVGLAGVDLDLEDRPAIVAHHGRADDGLGRRPRRTSGRSAATRCELSRDR